jgi:hypothetical protein
VAACDEKVEQMKRVEAFHEETRVRRVTGTLMMMLMMMKLMMMKIVFGFDDDD